MTNFIIQEIFPYREDERYQLVKEAPELQVVDGYLPVSDGPGLRVELDEKAIAAYECIRVE